MAKEKMYVAHVCRNSRKHEFIKDPSGKMIQHKDKKTGIITKKPKMIPNPEYCDRIWIDVDRTGAMDIPTTQFYCKDCLKRGYKNPKKIKPELSIEEKQKFAEKMQKGKKTKANKKIVKH